VGSIKLRLFRPFPSAELAKMVEGLKGVAIMDRAVSIGAQGPVFPEARSALYESNQRPRLTNYVYGLGGRDIRPEDLKHVFNQLIRKEGDTVNYLGVRI
jgi:pyruvate ferredoxin oxidoreductase alpha subunit